MGNSFIFAEVSGSRRDIRPEDEKGTPVRIRDYTRSCKFCKQTVLSKATVRDDGKAYGWNESEDLPGRITGVSLREQRRAGDDSHIQ